MSTVLSEDDLYRTSTQYRLWSFSPEGLAALRANTHSIAVQRARQYTTDDDGSEPEHLSEEEELRLIQKYTDTLRITADHLKIPQTVKATAAQYLKRFYLSNSCMTYPPKDIYKTVLYLAAKTENAAQVVSDYARRISTEPEMVLAPEYKVMQALRFTLEVRHPFRGLKGVHAEMLNAAEGLVAGVVDGKSGEDVQREMLGLAMPRQEDRTPFVPPKGGKMNGKELERRVNAAYDAAKKLLDGPAMLTDVYFLYTPSQMVLAALHLSDEPMTSHYLGTKFSLDSPIRQKVMVTIHSCADMLASYDTDSVLTKDERAELEKKLERCRDPSTRDMVKLFQQARQGSDDEDGEKAKRRKLEREKGVKEGDIFGPDLKK